MNCESTSGMRTVWGIRPAAAGAWADVRATSRLLAVAEASPHGRIIVAEARPCAGARARSIWHAPFCRWGSRCVGRRDSGGRSEDVIAIGGGATSVAPSAAGEGAGALDLTGCRRQLSETGYRPAFSARIRLYEFWSVTLGMEPVCARRSSRENIAR